MPTDETKIMSTEDVQLAIDGLADPAARMEVALLLAGYDFE